MNRANSQADGFQIPESMLNLDHGFVISHALLVRHVVFAKRGANDVDAINCNFSDDAVFSSPEQKRRHRLFHIGSAFSSCSARYQDCPARQSRIASRDNDIRFLVTIVLKNQEVEQENESWCRRI